MLQWIILLLLPLSMLCAKERETSYPYLAGDTWRFFCDKELSIYRDFNPSTVQPGETIFVEQDSLYRFRRDYLPHIKKKFILITANSEQGGDDPLPGIHRDILDSPMVYKWFIQNIDCEQTDKLILIPIGLANKIWEHGDFTQLDCYVPIGMEIRADQRPTLAYLNFNMNTNVAARLPCLEYFQNRSYCKIQPPKYYGDYLIDLLESSFVISPRGNGLDCHRTWEALLMGCYPIVITSTLDPLYEDLPVVIVNRWEEINEAFLREKVMELSSREWSREKLYAPYWFERVSQFQNEIVGE